MANLLFKKGNFRILSDNVGELSPAVMNQLIKTAGTTSYQARESSKKTPEEFIQMVHVRGHLSVLEHSWYNFGISSKTPEAIVRQDGLPRELCWEIVAYWLYDANNLFCITKRENGLLVSGNARMFQEAFIGGDDKARMVLKPILLQLHKENPVLFPEEYDKSQKELGDKLILLTRNPELVSEKETLIHRAMTVEFNDCSRGFTHEDVRSRNGRKQIVSYTQESTRYVDYSRGEEDLARFQMKLILPYNDQIDFGQSIKFQMEGRDFDFTPQQFTNLIQEWYRALRKMGFRPEEARQWLPIGLKAQIVQTFNLNEWRHWFSIRTQKAAHPEIRFVAVSLLQNVQKRMVGVFDNFQIAQDGLSATFVGQDHLV